MNSIPVANKDCRRLSLPLSTQSSSSTVQLLRTSPILMSAIPPLRNPGSGVITVQCACRTSLPQWKERSTGHDIYCRYTTGTRYSWPSHRTSMSASGCGKRSTFCATPGPPSDPVGPSLRHLEDPAPARNRCLRSRSQNSFSVTLH